MKRVSANPRTAVCRQHHRDALILRPDLNRFKTFPNEIFSSRMLGTGSRGSPLDKMESGYLYAQDTRASCRGRSSSMVQSLISSTVDWVTAICQCRSRALERDEAVA